MKKNHVELQPSVIHQAKAPQPDTASRATVARSNRCPGMIMSLTNHEMQSGVKEIVVLSFPGGEPPSLQAKQGEIPHFARV
jgi:hypothetical protein